MNDSIKLAIDRLYEVFKIYQIKDPANVSFFDFGPNAEEFAGISNELRNIPTRILDRMEFYEAGWNSWGTENEVKYLLPRLLECISFDINRLDDPGYFSLFKYKLKNCFSVTNKDWSDIEKNCIKKFFDVLLECHLSKSVEIGFLIECVLTLDMSPDYIVSKWNSKEVLHKNQVINLFTHFNCLNDGKFYSPKGVYLDNNEKIKKFIDYVYTKLTPEELAEISFCR